MKIKGCVFDFGGVMTTATMPERVRNLTNELGIDWSAIETGFAKYRRLMDGGFIGIDEMYDNIWADAALDLSPEIRAKILAEDSASFIYRNDATLSFMRKLKSEGFKIGILTNMSREFAELFKEHFPDFIETADAVVVSGCEKMFKPQKRIYDLLASRIALRPEELCFFDDNGENCAGARAAGWRAVQFANLEQAERDFRALVSE